MLTLTITSFSFLYGPHPKDETGNGGGFVFDCRSLPNPGRYQEYRTLSGRDAAVCLFLDQEAEVEEFLALVFKLVSLSVKKYQEIDFTNLMVNFGCTGGQHRSVYCAEKLAEYLPQHFNLKINLIHLREEVWG